MDNGNLYNIDNTIWIMQQIRLENWDWIPDGQSDTPNVKGSSRRYAFRDYSDKIKLNTKVIKGRSPKIKKTKLKGITFVNVGSIGEVVQLHRVINRKEIIKKFPSAVSYYYEYTNGTNSQLKRIL